MEQIAVPVGRLLELDRGRVTDRMGPAGRQSALPTTLRGASNGNKRSPWLISYVHRRHLGPHRDVLKANSPTTSSPVPGDAELRIVLTSGLTNATFDFHDLTERRRSYRLRHLLVRADDRRLPSPVAFPAIPCRGRAVLFAG